MLGIVAILCDAHLLLTFIFTFHRIPHFFSLPTQMMRHPALRPVPCPALLPRPIPVVPVVVVPVVVDPVAVDREVTKRTASAVPSPTPVASSSSTTSSRTARRLGMAPTRTIGTTTSSKTTERGRNIPTIAIFGIFGATLGPKIFSPHPNHHRSTYTNQPTKPF